MLGRSRRRGIDLWWLLGGGLIWLIRSRGRPDRLRLRRVAEPIRWVALRSIGIVPAVIIGLTSLEAIAGIASVQVADPLSIPGTISIGHTALTRSIPCCLTQDLILRRKIPVLRAIHRWKLRPTGTTYAELAGRTLIVMITIGDPRLPRMTIIHEAVVARSTICMLRAAIDLLNRKAHPRVTDGTWRAIRRRGARWKIGQRLNTPSPYTLKAIAISALALRIP
jgi:hypothetical protein